MHYFLDIDLFPNGEDDDYPLGVLTPVVDE